MSQKVCVFHVKAHDGSCLEISIKNITKKHKNCRLAFIDDPRLDAINIHDCVIASLNSETIIDLEQRLSRTVGKIYEVFTKEQSSVSRA